MIDRNIRRLAVTFILCFVLVGFASAYWQVMRAPELLAREDNPRHLEEERRIQRGRIYDRHGVELAHTEIGRDETRRIYVYPPLAHVIGYWSLRHGTANVERAYDDHLRGLVGLDQVTALRNYLFHRPQVGHDVVLTIDLELQRVADEALGDASGAIILLDAGRGDILALASHPYYDPNTLDESWEKLKEDEARLLLNRATQGLYPPGSTFKTVTLAAALEEGLMRPNTSLPYTLSPPDKGHRLWWHENEFTLCQNHPDGKSPFSLSEAYAFSCNVAFSEIGLQLGPKTYVEYAERFGLEQEIRLEVPTAVSRLFHTPDYFIGYERFYALASTAFGQGELAITPLQMALIAASIANGGVMPSPRLVLRVQDSSGVILEQTEGRSLGKPIAPQTARQVDKMMVFSVEGGWARRAQIPGVKVAGKTGTAQVSGEDGGQEPHAWFIGYAPADGNEARYVIAVLIENGGEGSLVAAPLARKVLEAALSRD